MPKLISLFAGAGGLDLGLEQAGFTTLLASDAAHWACETLRQNKLLQSLKGKEVEDWFQNQLKQRCYKNASKDDIENLRRRIILGSKEHRLAKAVIVEEDIRALKSETILDLTKQKRGTLDLIAGGPPCQPFSRAGKRQTMDVEQGRLFLEFVRIVHDLRPRFFLFENVKGLVLSKTEVPHIRCNECGTKTVAPFFVRQKPNESVHLPCRKCSSTNTELTWSNIAGGSLDIILNEFESIGYKCVPQILNAANFGAPQNRERLFIVGSRDGEAFSWPSKSHAESSVSSNQSELQFDSPLPNIRCMKDVLWKNGHWRYGKLDPSKAVLWVKNVVRPHDEPVTWTLDRPSPTIGAHQGAKLALAPFGVPEAQLARQQWHVLGRRQGDTPPVFVEHEYLTDEELLTIQTFPQDWYLYGTRMERAFQIGNAVPPALAKAVGSSIYNCLQSKVATHTY